MAILFAGTLLAQSHYPFQIDQDSLGGAADFSFLNRPIEAADRLFVRDGHFTRCGADLVPNTADDERIRLFGANLAFGANFPEEQDAARIARRLRKLGVNVVRLHHMDSQPDRDPNNAGSLLTTGPYPTLNPVAVKRLRAFLNALKTEGIYANLNLHVGYTFRPAVDGVPGLANFPSQSKPLHIFFPRMMELQANYTRQVIEALGLKGDPVLAMVEIDNESSLLHDWQARNLDQYLQGDYRDELTRQWNTFLSARYESTESLSAAWGATGSAGADVLPSTWRIENHSPARGSNPEWAMGSDVPTVRVQLIQSGDVVILKQVGFSVSTDRHYTAEVEIRADLPSNASGSVYWDIKQDVSPWRTMAGSNVTVTNEWRRYAMGFQPSFAMDGIGRFGLSIEKLGAGATVYVRNACVYPTGRRGLSEGESLEAATVSLVGENEYATGQRTDDYLQFLVDRDRAYLNGMLAAVREGTDSLVPVTGTQMGYGGLLNLDSHRDLDYLDNHFYVDHYNFPNVAWDGRDWRIRDTCGLCAGLDAFQSMAIARQAGRPYTVSEYNQPWPNRHGAEIDPTLAAFGAFQDWDGIMHFAYAHGRDWANTVPAGFNINGDWTKFPNIGQAAWLFRWGAITPAREAIDVPVASELRKQSGREKRGSGISQFLNAALGYVSNNVFVHAVRLSKDTDVPVPSGAKAVQQAPFESDTGELTYDPDQRLYLIHAAHAAGVFGYIGGRKVTSGAIDVELPQGGRGFASLLVTSLDWQPLANSTRMLLTNPGYTLRTQPGSSPARPQQIVNYGTAKDWWTLEQEPASSKPSGNLNGGEAPAWMERVEAYVTLRTAASKISIYPLDGAGSRLAELPAADIERVDGGFRLHLQADGQAFAPWYEILCEY